MIRLGAISPVIIAIAVLFTTSTHATNGYFTHGIGVKNKAMAGAGTASPDEAIASAVNPASAVLVGDRLDIGVSLFSPRRSYESSASLAMGNGGAFTLGPDKIDSDSDYFVIPDISKIWARGEDSAIGVSFYGRGGMNTDFSGGTATFDPDSPLGPAPIVTLPGIYGGGTTGVNLSQAFLDLTYARKSGDFSWGLSAVFAVQMFEAKGVGNFAGFTKSFASSGGTVFPENLSNNGTDWSFGYGAKFGVIWQASESVSLALAYQTKMNMSDFDDYSDLFAQGGGFDIPASIRGGFSIAANENLNLHFDVEHSMFSDVGSVGNEIQNLFACPTVGGTDLESCLGGQNGPGFGWKDVTTYKFGADWKVSSMPDWTWRAGYSYGKQPIRSDQLLFNILAPAVIESHFTAGTSKTTSTGRELSFGIMFAPSKSVSGTNTFDPTQTLEIKMKQFELDFTFSF